jgi:hypothetical protein
VTDSYNLTSKELKKIVDLVKKNEIELKERWDEYFKK